MDNSILSKDLFNAFHKDNHHKKSITNVNNIVFTKLSKGENYVADAYRLEVSYLRYDGSEVVEFYFLKRAPSEHSKLKYFFKLGLFQKEVKAYTELLPQMEHLLHSVGDYTELLWPECVGIRRFDIVLMRDLLAQGYKKCDKRIGLDLEHSVLVLKALAKFHAVTVVLDDKMLLDTASFEQFGFTHENEDYQQLVHGRIKIVAELMKTWGDRWQNLRKALEDNYNQGFHMMVKACKFNPDGFNVVIHGDLWTSNILFKRCNFTGNLCGVKFLDYQECHYNSYAIDIQYFLNSSVQGNVRASQHVEMMRAYHESLIDTFKLLNHEPIRLPTFDQVLKEVENKRAFGLITSISLLHLMQAKAEDAVDVNDWLQGNQSDDVTRSKHFEVKAKEILEPYLNVDLKCFL